MLSTSSKLTIYFNLKLTKLKTSKFKYYYQILNYEYFFNNELWIKQSTQLAYLSIGFPPKNLFHK